MAFPASGRGLIPWLQGGGINHKVNRHVYVLTPNIPPHTCQCRQGRKVKKVKRKRRKFDRKGIRGNIKKRKKQATV
jgi:hypothetical protein